MIKTEESAVIQLSRKVEELEERLIGMQSVSKEQVPLGVAEEVMEEVSEETVEKAEKVESTTVEPTTNEADAVGDEVEEEIPTQEASCNSEEVSAVTEEPKKSEVIDAFDLWDMLDSFQNSASLTAAVASSNTESEIAREEAEESAPIGVMDLPLFNTSELTSEVDAMSTSGPKAELLMEEAVVDETQNKQSSNYFDGSEWEEVQRSFRFLFESDPMIETCLSMGCEPAFENGLVFRTKYGPIYRIIRAYQEAGKFTASFRIELV